MTAKKIKRGNVTRGKIAANAVNGAKVGDGTLGSADVADGSLVAVDVAAGVLAPQAYARVLGNGTLQAGQFKGVVRQTSNTTRPPRPVPIRRGTASTASEGWDSMLPASS